MAFDDSQWLYHRDGKTVAISTARVTLAPAPAKGFIYVILLYILYKMKPLYLQSQMGDKQQAAKTS